MPLLPEKIVTHPNNDEICEENKKIVIKAHFLDSSASNLKFPAKTVLEDVLKLICKFKNISYPNYTLDICESDKLAELKPTEMDRRLDYYVKNPLLIYGFFVAKRAKTYSSVSIRENGFEVMVKQIVEGNNNIILATTDKIIQSLIDTNVELDEKLLNIILLTYRSYSTSFELFQCLINLYELMDGSKIQWHNSMESFVRLAPYRSSDSLKGEVNEEYSGIAQAISNGDLPQNVNDRYYQRKRILYILNCWVDKYWIDFGHNDDLHGRLERFLHLALKEPDSSTFYDQIREISNLADLRVSNN